MRVFCNLEYSFVDLDKNTIKIITFIYRVTKTNTLMFWVRGFLIFRNIIIKLDWFRKKKNVSEPTFEISLISC